MERCAPPRLESTGTDASPPDSVTEKDGYECRICGYKAPDVKRLSQHLHAAHPVTSLTDSSARSEKHEERVGPETPCFNGARGSRLIKSPHKERPATPNGSVSTSLETPEDSNGTSSSMEVHEQEERTEVSPSPKAMPSSSILPPHGKSSCSSESKQSCHKRQNISSGTSTHNLTHLVCLPLVSEGLKLIWVRSEQIHELDAISELVEAFNAFPYPTSQEASALARKCALPPDRVKAWFMMQRVRYGISWGDDDIQETRQKLCRIQKNTVAEECEEDDVEEDELQDYLGDERRSLNEQQQVSKQPRTADAHVDQRDHTPKHSRTVPQHATNDQYRFDFTQHNNAPQSNNGVQQLLNSDVVYNNGFVSSPQFAGNSQFQSDSRNVPPHSTGVQLSDAFGHLQYMTMNDQHTTTQYHYEPYPPAQSFQTFPGKKSKAQLMALRRSFVRKSWPSDAEVLRLQRITGLSRRDIRKWFADSRYQLRKNGRAWLAKLARRNRSLQLLHNSQKELEHDAPLSGSVYSDNNEADITEARYQVDVGMADDDVESVNQSKETKEEVGDDDEFVDSNTSFQQYPAACSPSHSTPSPSLSFHLGRVEPNARLRKKTREQLEILRQSFLHCQWPTSDDYFILQQKTGLTRTEIIQWYGDTRYHVKHNQMRWMTSQERERIVKVIMQQQKRGGKHSRGRVLLEGAGSGLSLENSTSINGGGGGETGTWNELFRGSPPVLPGGKL